MLSFQCFFSSLRNSKSAMSKTSVLNIAKIVKLKPIKLATSEAQFLYLLLIADLEFLSDEKKH